MIVWSGLGILVPFIYFGCMLAGTFLLKLALGDDLDITRGWPVLVCSGVAGVVIWMMGKKLNGPTGRVIHDRKSGRQYQERGGHSLFFIPMQFWAVVAIGFGVSMFLADGSNKSKRPAKKPMTGIASPQVDDPGAGKPNWRLSGISKLSEEKGTWVFNLQSSAGKSKLVKLGEKIGPWEVHTYTNDTLVLLKEAGEKLSINESGSH